LERLTAAVFGLIAGPETVAATDSQNRDLFSGGAEWARGQRLSAAGSIGSRGNSDASKERSA
jgi:hypothetical protein